MKSIFSFLSAVIITFSMTGCSPDTPANTGTQSPFILKYEITTSVPISPLPPGSNLLYFTNATGQAEFVQNLPSGTIWTKEINVTTSIRPFFARLYGPVQLTTPGTATGKIYVNGQEVASVTNPSSVDNIVVFQMSYSVN